VSHETNDNLYFSFILVLLFAVYVYIFSDFSPNVTQKEAIEKIEKSMIKAPCSDKL